MRETWEIPNNSRFLLPAPHSECLYRHLRWILGIQGSQREPYGPNGSLLAIPPRHQQVSGSDNGCFGAPVSLGPWPPTPHIIAPTAWARPGLSNEPSLGLRIDRTVEIWTPQHGPKTAFLMHVLGLKLSVCIFVLFVSVLKYTFCCELN